MRDFWHDKIAFKQIEGFILLTKCLTMIVDIAQSGFVDEIIATKCYVEFGDLCSINRNKHIGHHTTPSINDAFVYESVINLR